MDLTHLIFMEMKYKLNPVVSLVIVISLFLIASNTIIYMEVNEMNIPLSSYLIVVIALFFINITAFMFLQMDYMSNRIEFSKFVLSLTFFGCLVYFAETIIIIQKPVNDALELQIKANDTAIFYLFRQMSFIILLILAIYSYKLEQSQILNGCRKIKIMVYCLFPTFIMPIIAHNLSSHNATYTLMLTNYLSGDKKAIWNIQYINALIILWSLTSYFIVKVTKLSSDIWNGMLVICLSAIMYNTFLLLLDKYNLSIWYLSRAIEVLSKLFVIGTLMNCVFVKLKIANHLAIRDPMTNIHNRRFFFTRLEEILKSTCQNICVMVIDLDDFKSINDTWGHPTGDSTLLAVVDIIGQYIGPNDIFARIGGEEFGIIVKKSSLKDAIEFSNMLRNNVKIETAKGNKYNIPRTITLSVGGTLLTSGTYSVGDVIKAVDNALYSVKNNGKDGIMFAEVN